MACSDKFIHVFNRLQVNCGDGVLDPSNVMFYGAKGDGVTDDTAAFQAALASGVGDINIPCGTYILSSTLTIPTKTILKGESMCVVLKSSADTALNMAGPYSALKNCFLLYSGVNVATSIGILFSGTQSSQIENVRFGAQANNVFAYGISMVATAASNVNLNSVKSSIVTGYISAIKIDGSLSAAIGNAFYNIDFSTLNASTDIVSLVNTRGSNFISSSLSGTSTNGFNLDANSSSNTLINPIELGTITNLIVDASGGDNLIVEPAGAGVFSAIKGQEYYSAGIKVVGTQQAAIADASGGATVDTEARAAINTLLAELRTHGLIAT